LPDPPADCDIDTDIARWPQPSGEHGHTGRLISLRFTSGDECLLGAWWSWPTASASAMRLL